MAVIHQRGSEIQENYKSYRIYMIIFGFLTLVVFVVWGWNVTTLHSFDPYFVLPVFVLFIVFGYLARYFKEKADKLEAGLVGEQYSGDLFSQLPDSFHVYPNIQIEGKRSKSRIEIDHLIVGDNGIFIIESKNYRGMLSGNVQDRELVKEKVSPGGVADVRKVRNPIFQVKNQIRVVKALLEQEGVHTEITGAVYYVNGDFYYNVSGDDPYVSVFMANENGGREMWEMILDTANSQLTPQDKKKILKCLG